MLPLQANISRNLQQNDCGKDYIWVLYKTAFSKPERIINGQNRYAEL